MDHLESMRVFIRVADLGSFARAAVQLEVSRALVTRRIADLESHLRVRLLNRTTRSVSLTESGQLYFERVSRIVEQVESAVELVASSSTTPFGRLRIVAPVVFAQRNLGPALQNYRQRYPNVVPDLMLTNQDFDLVSQGYDLGIVPSTSLYASSTLIARPLVSTALIVCAAPGYLARHGAPSHPWELANHATLISLANLFTNNEWVFTGPDGEVKVALSPALVANDTEVLLQATLAEMGVGILPSAQVARDIDDGRLELLLPNHALPPLGLHVVYPSRQHLPAKVRTFIDFLIEYFQATPTRAPQLTPNEAWAPGP
jgi:DNA-binding transcriptional LysR family regulator